MYTVYVIITGTPRYLYVGQTKNYKRRMEEHKSGRKGARFTRRYGVKRHCVAFKTKSAARARELEARLIRRLRRKGLTLPDGEPQWVTEYRAELYKQHRGA